MMDVNLRQIRAFLTVVSAGGFTRAADLLRLSQPALTMRVRQLEDQVGVRLIDRGSRTLTLTREGSEIFPVFQRIVRDFDAAIADVKSLTQAEKETLRIAALPSFCTGPLASLLVDFKSRHPALNLILRDVVSRRINEMVLQEEVDFGIGVEGEDVPELEYVDLCEDRLMLVHPVGHPLAETPHLTLADVAPLPLIVMDAETSVRRLVDRAFAQIGAPINQACEATYMATAVSMVRAGLGVTLLPSSAVEIGIYNDIAARAVEGPGLTRRIVMVRRRPPALKPHAEALFKALLAAPLPPVFTSTNDLGYRAVKLRA